jgi:hypothetical protein
VWVVRAIVCDIDMSIRKVEQFDHAAIISGTDTELSSSFEFIFRSKASISNHKGGFNGVAWN